MTILDLHRRQLVATTPGRTLRARGLLDVLGRAGVETLAAAVGRAAHGARHDQVVPDERAGAAADDAASRAHRVPGAEQPGGCEETQEERLRHDLRQSLGLLMALTEGVRQDLGQVSEVLGHLDQMRHETEMMAALVSTQVETAAQPQRVDVGRIVADRWRCATTAAPCRMQLVCDAGTCAVLDPVGLARSTQNLLDNAVRAAGPDGAVVVQVRDHGDTVTVTVTDTGPGFGNVPTQQGLGLVTVRRFAAECGGTLKVTGAPDGGAELVLRLPSATPTVEGLTCAS